MCHECTSIALFPVFIIRIHTHTYTRTVITSLYDYRVYTTVGVSCHVGDPGVLYSVIIDKSIPPLRRSKCTIRRRARS